MTTAKLISIVLFCSQLYATDIVQVDVGTSATFRGTLVMDKTKMVHESEHGTHMARALEGELKRQGSKPVSAVQAVWDYKAHSRQSLIDAYKQALNENPLVVSLSFGGPQPDFIEESLMLAMAMHDIVIVAAAGNEGGGTHYFPANYKNECILSVGTTAHGSKAFYSNHGSVWLEYNQNDPPGTSASAARMAAIVLQIRRQNPKMTCENVVLTVKMLYGRMH